MGEDLDVKIAVLELLILIDHLHAVLVGGSFAFSANRGKVAI